MTRTPGAVITLMFLLFLGGGALVYAKREAIYWKTPPRYYEPIIGLFDGFRADYDVMVPMRDGVRLATDIYYPVDKSRAPFATIFIRTPYSKERAFQGGLVDFTKMGYVVAIQDVRGKFHSEGVMMPYHNDGEDGSDTVSWIAKQNWSNGRVGTMGCSSSGELQMVLARERNPHHAAMIAQGAGGAMGSAMGIPVFGSYDGGIFDLEGTFGWFAYSGGKTGDKQLERKIDDKAPWGLPTIGLVRRYRNDPTDYEDYLSKPFSDSYWKKIEYLEDDTHFSTPALVIDAWLDPRIGDTFRMSALMQRNWTGATAEPELHVIIAPGTHCAFSEAGKQGQIGDLPVTAAMQPYDEWYAVWFDYWLRDNAAKKIDLPRYRFFVLGENRWIDSPTWPPQGIAFEHWYLDGTSAANTVDGGGTLIRDRPARAAREDTFAYDPKNPVPSCIRKGGTVCLDGHVDQREVEARNDVLVYTSPSLPEPLRIAGPLRAELYVSSSARDTDFMAKLVDVWPDGKALNIQEGALRMRYRDSFTKPELMTPPKVYLAKIDMRAIAYYLPAGHRLRLEVTSSSFPRLERNLNTGGNNYDETVGVIALNKVHADATHPSAVIIPEWPAGSVANR